MHLGLSENYSVVQKNSSMFEFPAFLLPKNLVQPIHCPSALKDHVSLNLLSMNFFARSFTACTAIWKVIPYKRASMICLEGCTKITFPGCVNMGWETVGKLKLLYLISNNLGKLF